MEKLLEELKKMGLNEKMEEEELYVEFLSRMGINRFSDQEYKIYLGRIGQIYNICKGGYVNNLGEVFLCNRLDGFKDRNNPIPKDHFFDIVLSSQHIYFYPQTAIHTFLTTDTPYKVLKDIGWVSF